MEALEVPYPLEVAKIGDTASDLQEGSSAGCGWVIGVTSGAYTRVELAKEPHTHLVGQIPEILPILSFASAVQNA
jgi:phosphoglycolate phosphatase-like HAD superfamily hydrolase